MNGTRGLVIGIAAAFIVGCSVGLMGGIVFSRFAFHPGPPPFPPRHGGPGGPGGPREGRMFSYMERELDLSKEQSKRIEALIDRARHEHEAVRESMQVALDRELTPEQRARWKRMETEMGMRRRRGPDGPPDGPGGPPPPDRP